jgi:hypothetical protein
MAELTHQDEALLKRADPSVFPVSVGQMRQAIAEHLPALDALHHLLLAEEQDETEAAPAGLLPEQRLAVLERLQRLREQLAAEDFDAQSFLAQLQGECAGNVSGPWSPSKLPWRNWTLKRPFKNARG